MLSRAMVAAAFASSLWLPALLAAQAPFGDSWRWTEFTTEAGLPSNAVVDLVEARDGTPWAATDGGVAWYDGFQWHAVRAGEELSTRRPQVLVADPAGGVLVVIHSRLFRGDTTGLRILPLFIDSEEQAVTGVAPLDDGRILLLVSDLPEAALYLYERGRLTRVSPPTALPGERIPGLWRTERGTIWLNAAGGLYRWNAGRWVLQLPAPPPGFQVARLFEGASGAGLAFIRHPDEVRGLWEWTADRPFRRDTAEGSNELASLDMGPTGEALAVYETGHVRLRRGGAWTPVEPLPPELRNVAFVRFRKTGDLWVGGRTGLSLYRSSSARWAGRAHPFPDYRNRINAILRARDGSLWAGTSDGVEVHRPNGTVSWTHTVLGIRLGAVTGLVEDREGQIWLSSGSTFTGALRWDGRRWARFAAAQGLDALIHRIVRDRQGRLWFLGLSPREAGAPGPGTFLYSGGRFEHWGPARGLPSGQVYALAQGPDSALWFGTGAGLSRWSGGRWTHWTSPDSTPGRLRGLIVPVQPFVLAVDVRGRTWFGDRTLGLGFVGADDRLGFLTTRDGLLDNAVWDVQPEDDGGLWIATSGGLSHYRDGVWSRFDPDGGLVIPRIWPVLPLADRVYVGTLGGGLQILSRAEATNPAPRIAILAPLIDKGVAHVRWSAFSYWGATMRAGLDTRYRVDGGPWSAWTRDRGVVLPDLAPGTHELQVQGKGLFGGFDPAGATARIAIPLPLALRPLFAVPVGGLTAALIVLGVIAGRRKRRAEAVLRDSEERFRMLSEAAFEGIGVNENGVIVEANQRLAEMLGCELRELIGSPVLEFVAPDARDLVRQRMVGESLDRQGPYEHLARRKDGSIFPVEVQGRAVRFRGREARVAAIRDITQRKQAEEALRISEEKFSKAFRLSPGPSLISRLRDGLVVEVNAAFIEASGYPREALIGNTTTALIWPTPADRAAVVAELEAHGRVLAREVRVRTAAGEHRDFYFSAELIDLEGEPHVLGVSMDITERKRAERELRASREQLQALSRRLLDAQETERATIARELHDEIGQALTAVKLNLQGIGRLAPDARIAAHVAEGVAVLDAAMEGVRDLALDLRPSLLDDLGLVAAVRWYTTRLAERAGLEAAFEADALVRRLPKEIETACFRVAQEALTNVVRHARARRVRVELRSRDRELEFIATDDGVGFDARAARDEGAPLRRLGLVGMEERVSLVGGRLAVESVRGRGTVVRATLPFEPRVS